MAINSNVKQEESEREKVETTSRLDVTSPTEAIIAFGSCGENQILKNGKNKWEKSKGRDGTLLFAFVGVNKNVFIIGGFTGVTVTTCTDIYNIVSQTWSQGPTLNIGRLEKSSLPFKLHESVKLNAF